MKSRHFRDGLTVALALGLSWLMSTAEAATLYTSGSPNQLGGNEMTEWIQAEDFSLSSAATLQSVEFWNLQQSNSYNGSIHWDIYADSGGKPGALLDSGDASSVTRSATGNSAFGLSEYQDDFSLGGVGLAAGSYWLGLHNGPLSDQTRAEFYWETTTSAGDSFAQEDIAPFNGNWFSNGADHAFVLSGDLGSGGASSAPLPASASAGITLLALAGFWIRLGRRRVTGP